MRFLKRLIKNVILDPKEVKTKQNLIGYAVLIYDDISGMKMWATYRGDGKAHTNLSPMQPLVFPVEKLGLGTRIDWYGSDEIE